jgi:hypothetical protein
LGINEEALAQLEVAMALDDPLVMARHVAAGNAIEGTVVARDDSNQVVGPTGRRRSRPIITLRADEPVLQPLGTELVWAADVRVRGEICGLPLGPGDPITIMVTAGMRAGDVPLPGQRGIFTTLIPPNHYPDTVPDEVPWTHQTAMAATTPELA